MSGFQWADLLRAGVQGLGLRPDQVWSLSPGEFRLMMGDHALPTMGRDRLAELLLAFPDDLGDPGKTAEYQALKGGSWRGQDVGSSAQRGGQQEHEHGCN